MNKAFLIALVTWVVLSLALTFVGVEFIRAVGAALIISLIALVFFEYEFFQVEKE